MARIGGRVQRVPNSLWLVVGAACAAVLLVAVLRLVLGPSEEAMLRSVAVERTTPPPATVAPQPTLVATVAPTLPLQATRAATPSAAGAAASALPSIGATQVTPANLAVRLVAVEAVAELEQFHGQQFRPQNGVYALVTIQFKNASASPTTIRTSAIELVAGAGAPFKVDSRGLSALSTMPQQRFDRRPMFVAESLLPGEEKTVVVAFDIPADSGNLRVTIEGLTFATTP
ncbi:MAG: DUF4352 domain-containing protein [Actinobacteria bacterium]|nr:DUF4352 domain-containing protein [Actinomycetota bacterium]